jgi:hypothetical protein
VTSSAPRLGSFPWLARTGGQLSPADRRALMRPLLWAHVFNALGRATMVLRLNSGRWALVPPHELRQPASVLTIAAEQEASRCLTPAMLHHSYRTYLFGAAVGHLEHVDVDRELLFASAMLHDTGLRPPVAGVDFSLASAAVALRTAENVGLSTAATQVMRNAIALHHSPDVTLATDGPVAYLLSAGAALDVVGLRSWKVPPSLLHQVVVDHPRLAFKREFTSAVAAEAAAVPHGRMDLLRRYGAFDLAIRLAPFPD